MGPRFPLSLLPLLTLASLAVAQTPAPGFRLYSRAGQTDTKLLDTNDNVVHTWPSSFNPGVSVYLQPDGVLLRSIFTGNTGPGGIGGGVQQQALDGSVLWDFRYDTGGVMSHHDIEPMPNGNVMLIAWEEKTLAEAIAAGRDPAITANLPFMPDHLVEVDPVTDTIVWEWHFWDHLIQDHDPTKDNFGVVGDHPELLDINYPAIDPPDGDWNHVNSVDYDPIHDWILISAPRQSEIYIIDHSTTTAEAAGHTGGNYGKGGDFLWRWGNPEAYRAGTAADQKLIWQHAPTFILPGHDGAGNVLVFNNQAPGGSAVWELELPLDPSDEFILGAGGTYGPSGPVWSYSDPGFQSDVVSNAERLPNGNTLICAGFQAGRIFEITTGGTIVFEHIEGAGAIVFHAHYVEHCMWSDIPEMSAAAGGVATFDLIAGSDHAGAVYLVLGSLTGTSPGFLAEGLLVPLEIDGYLIATLSFANTPPFGNTTGTLNSLGRGQATLTMPPGVLNGLVGFSFHHAFVAFDTTLPVLAKASNAASFLITP